MLQIAEFRFTANKPRTNVIAVKLNYYKTPIPPRHVPYIQPSRKRALYSLALLSPYFSKGFCFVLFFFPGAMEGSSSSQPSDSNHPTASGASKFLADLPSLGFFSSTVVSSNPVISLRLLTLFKTFKTLQFYPVFFLVAEKKSRENF